MSSETAGTSSSPTHLIYAQFARHVRRRARRQNQGAPGKAHLHRRNHRRPLRCPWCH